jgi:TfoX/Sxy family transcriptional regulator of competence genes
MVASDGFAEFLRDQLAPLGRITMRRMFGKTGVFCDGFMLGMVRDNTLYFRVDDDNRAAFKEAESFPPLDYQKKGAPSIFRSGALRSACSTSPMSLSFGRWPRSPRRGGLPRRGNARRESENQSLNCEAGIR